MYIINLKRTPIGKFQGKFSMYSAPQLLQSLFSYFLKQYPFLKQYTDEVIIGEVLTAGVGQNPARIAACLGGLSDQIPAYTVNQVCASGMTAIAQATRAIRAGDAQLVLAGGMESMSQAPFFIRNYRTGVKFGHQQIEDSLIYDGLYCSLSHKLMSQTAEIIAKKLKISRGLQDRFALRSHHLYFKAQNQGIFNQEIITITGLNQDESPRSDTSLAKLSKLKPLFSPQGTVTAGNASPLSDGAALCLVASENMVKKYQLKPMARILDHVSVGAKPELMGLGPVYAIKKLLKRNHLKTGQIDLYEINEAFAVQVLAVIQQLKVNPNKVNPFGGAIALGHPLGMSGIRIVGSLITGLKHTGGRLGIASLCVGGGQGSAMLIESL